MRDTGAMNPRKGDPVHTTTPALLRRSGGGAFSAFLSAHSELPCALCEGNVPARPIGPGRSRNETGRCLNEIHDVAPLLPMCRKGRDQTCAMHPIYMLQSRFRVREQGENLEMPSVGPKVFPTRLASTSHPSMWSTECQFSPE